MSINFRDVSIIDSLTGGTHQWTVGTGSLGIWTVNGSSAESQRLYDTDPFGNESIVWQTNPDVVSGPDGGWNTSYMALDKTKLYRFSVWGRRTSSTTSGTWYFGLTGSADILQVNDGSSESNPYWGYPTLSNLTQNLWYLHVGHVFPVDYRAESDGYQVTSHPNSGRWTVAGGRIGNHIPAGGNIGGDAKFSATTSSIRHRCYHFYSTSTAAHMQFFDPRIEVCDGSEGTVESLLSGTTTESGNQLSSTSITKEGAAFKNQSVNATGGNKIMTVGDWKYHVFTGSSSFIVNSYVGSGPKADYLIVGGGGGGGARMGGGGGGGGVLTGYCYVTGTTYTVTVGAGGTGGDGASSATYRGTNGGNSSFNGLTATGGGAGGGGSNTDGKSAGLDGGSGGGASAYNSGTPPSPTFGSGDVGQGHNGGAQGPAYYGGSGGGGMTAGTTATGLIPATGGTGTFSTILSRPYYWGAGGGGAGAYSYPHGGAGGPGGGGGAAPGTIGGTGGEEAVTWGEDGQAGSSTSSADGGDGGAWTGGGGGGGAYSVGDGGAGGSGVIIIRYKYR